MKDSNIVDCAMTQADSTYGTIMKTTFVECAMVQAVVGLLMAELRRKYYCSSCHGSGCY